MSRCSTLPCSGGRRGHLGFFWMMLLAMAPTSWAMSNTHYCRMFGEDHTMCQYTETSSSCVPGVPKVTEDIQAVILDVHNKLRQKVANDEQPGQPPASNMRQMVWNRDLAKVAQRWANQCIFGHDTNRVTREFPEAVGQNVAEVVPDPTATDLGFTTAINMWYNEVSIYQPGDNNIFVWSMATGHYTQVAWANTWAVGCGFSQFYDSDLTSLIVCNYGPAGNMDDELLYKVGDACSACDDGLQCSTDYPGLCTPAD